MVRGSASTTSTILRPKFSEQFWPLAVITGIVLYIIIDVLLTFLRPDYNWLHNAESDYGRGPYAWLMDLDFLLRCLLSLALVRALWARFPGDKLLRHASYWIIVWAIASGLLAFFADNPYGYTHLWTGVVHLLLAFIAFIGVVVALLVVNRQLVRLALRPGAIAALLITTALAIVSLVLLGRAGIRPTSLGGLYERVFLGSVLAWEGIVACTLLSRSHKTM